MSTNKAHRRRMLLAIPFIISLLLLALIFWATHPVLANAAPTTRSNFYCEVQGEWSSLHFDISKAQYKGYGEWVLIYRDSGKTTLYLQRRGEDCRVETYPTPTGDSNANEHALAADGGSIAVE